MCEVLSAWPKAGAVSVSAVVLFYTSNSRCDCRRQVGFKLVEIREAASLGRSMGLNNTYESMVFKKNVSAMFDLQCSYTSIPHPKGGKIL